MNKVVKRKLIGSNFFIGVGVMISSMIFSRSL